MDPLNQAINQFCDEKLNKPGFIISPKKYDILACAYTKVLFVQTLYYINTYSEKKSYKGLVKANDVIKEILEKPDLYMYDTAISAAQSEVDSALSVMAKRSNLEQINALKSLAMSNFLKKNIRKMKSCLRTVKKNIEDSGTEVCDSEILRIALKSDFFEKAIAKYSEAKVNN